jgi:hypothetical protein
MSKRFGRFLRRNTIALLALFVALSGTTYAAANVVLPKNSVGAKQLKKNAVTNTKIAKNAVTGSKIKLSTVGKVPSAANADHATAADSATNATHATSADSATNATNATNAGNANTVGGQKITKVQWKVPPSTATQTILSLNGLTISGSCDATSHITIDAKGSTAKNAELRIQGNVLGTAFFKNVFNFDDATLPVSLMNADGTLSEGSGQLVYATLDGHVLTFAYGFDFGVTLAGGAYDKKFVGCTLYGEAVYS